jgi:type IV secretory pathway TrbF-like protein
MSDPFTPQPGAVDGQPLSSVEDDEWRRIEQAYKEIQRRDDRAEYRAWRKERLTWGLLLVVLVQLAVIVYQWWDHRQVQAFVQVVQVDDKGQLVQMGIPQELLAYQPPDGVWIDMLGEWVRRIRWRGTDPVLAKAQWAWVYRHTCGQARRILQTLEDKEQPFKSSKKLTAVELRSVTKTPVPESYQVLWSETTTEASHPMVKTALWTGTFSVGRMQLPTLTDALDNRLGLCVSAFDLSPQPGGH